MKRLLILLGVVLVLAIPAIMADDDDTPAPAVGETRVIKMQVESDGDMPSMMGMCGPGMGKGMGMGMGLKCCEEDDMGPGLGMCCDLLECKELNLTKEQVQKIKDLNYAHKYAMIDMKAGLEKAQLKMGQEIKGDNPNKDMVLAATREIYVIKGRIAEARIIHLFDLRAVLTAEQLEKVKACKGGGMCGSGPMGGGKCGPMGAAKCGGMAGGKTCAGAKESGGCGKGK